MAERAELSFVPKFHQKLEETLAEPEPMCLAMIHVDITGATTGEWAEPTAGEQMASLDQVMAAVQSRLSHQLRRYDLMARIEDDTFMLVVKTLADTRVLDARMYQLYGALSEPYVVGRQTVAVPIALGAAVRLPAEKAAALMRRADKALAAARAAGGKAPVLI